MEIIDRESNTHALAELKEKLPVELFTSISHFVEKNVIIDDTDATYPVRRCRHSGCRGYRHYVGRLKLSDGHLDRKGLVVCDTCADRSENP